MRTTATLLLALALAACGGGDPEQCHQPEQVSADREHVPAEPCRAEAI